MAAAVLSHRYIADRFLPDKAIDLVDEAASRLRMEIDSMPAELDEVERRIMQLEIEREALRKESDAASRERLGAAREGAGGAQGDAHAAGRAVAAGEGRDPGRARRRRKSSSSCAPEIERAQRAGDYAKASELQYGRIPAARARDRASTSRRRRRPARRACSRKQVDEEDIAEVVSRWTHIPGQPADGRRGPEARPDGGAPAPARRRPGRSGRRGRQRDPPRARRPAGSRTGRSAASSFSARPASARPSWRARSPSSCSTTSRRWSGSTCRSTRRSTRCRG